MTRSTKLAINLGLSFGMLALCLYFVWPDAGARRELSETIDRMQWSDFWPYLVGYIALLAVTHFCRAWRWTYLLEPLGVKLPGTQLLAISSVGFLAILALPARLGEFVRPALLRQKGHLSASAALGTVAVERIVDGLMVSVFVFGAFFALRGPDAPGWMMPTAYAALGGFALLFGFLCYAMARPKAAVDLALTMTFVRKLAPGFARKLEEKLTELIRGFEVMKRPRPLLAFCAYGLAYWVANGLSVWLLARGFGMPLSLMGGFATMGLVAVGITLPNSPGLVGQFQWFLLLGFSLYLHFSPTDQASVYYAPALACAITLHLLQVIWYVATGVLGMASLHVSVHDLREARKMDAPAGASDHPADAA